MTTKKIQADPKFRIKNALDTFCVNNSRFEVKEKHIADGYSFQLLKNINQVAKVILQDGLIVVDHREGGIKYTEYFEDVDSALRYLKDKIFVYLQQNHSLDVRTTTEIVHNLAQRISFLERVMHAEMICMNK